MISDIVCLYKTDEKKKDLQRTGDVKSQNRPPVKMQFYVAQFVILFQKHKFSLKLDHLNDSK
jgi:hypothetical protein